MLNIERLPTPDGTDCAPAPDRFRCTRDTFGADLLHAVGATMLSSLKMARWRIDRFDPTATDEATDFHVIDHHQAGTAYRSDRKDAAVGPRSISFEPADHSAVWRGDAENEYTHFYLCKHRLAALAEALTERPAAEVRFQEVDGAYDPELAALLDSCEAALRRSAAPCQLELDAWFQVIGIQIVRRWAGDNALRTLERPKPKMRQISAALEMIDAELGSEISLDRLASACAMSAHNFSRHFKATVGSTVYQYVLARRIERAQQMLRDTDKSIAAIAFHVGFSSQAHLTAMFKQRTGTTPRRFRVQ